MSKSTLKILPTLMVAITAALLLGTGNVARAVAIQDFTYVFNATSPSPYDGSTITIESLSLVNWDLLGPGGPLTPSNSTQFSTIITSADATTWIGNFNVHPNGAVVFFGSNEGPPGTGFLGSAVDPGGTWSFVNPASTPDSGSTFQLLAVACAGLGAWQWSRRRQAI